MPRLKITMRFIGAASVALATSVAIIASAGPANAIANGTPVPDGQYSFSAKLTMTGIPRPDGTLADSACSAALVAPQWIITAGHCFHDVNGNRVSGPTPYATTATVGRTDLSTTGGHVVDVVEVQQAPRGDVALGRLASPITDITPLAHTIHAHVQAGELDAARQLLPRERPYPMADGSLTHLTNEPCHDQ